MSTDNPRNPNHDAVTDNASLDPASVGGIVLCGGRSRRMGQDKAMLMFNGVTLVEHVVGLLGAVVSPVIVAAAVDQRLPEHLCRVNDRHPDAGPLEGLEIGLAALANETATGICAAAIVVGVDYPLLDAQLLRTLINRCGPDDDIVIGEVDGHRQPMPGLYRCAAVTAELTAARAAGIDSLTGLIERCRTQVIRDWSDVRNAHQAFCNVNTPAEWAEARRAWQNWQTTQE